MDIQTDNIPEDEEIPAPEVLVLPGEYFFVERVDVPEALEPSELDDFAELTMESLAPFPLEQLYWGFLPNTERTSILLYAALKDRIKRNGYKDLDASLWVLPDFDSLDGAEIPDTASTLVEEAEEEMLWRADVRPAEFKKVERNTRRMTVLISRSLRYCVYAFVALVAIEMILFTGQFWLNTRKAKVENQIAFVNRIQDKDSLMQKLEQVAQNELRPVDILDAANQIRLDLGNTGIVYDEALIDGSNRITIEGEAGTINEFNAYVESLNRSGAFELIGQPKSTSRGNEVTFSVSLDYNKPLINETVQPEPVEAAEPEVPQGNEEEKPSAT